MSGTAFCVPWFRVLRMIDQYMVRKTLLGGDIQCVELATVEVEVLLDELFAGFFAAQVSHKGMNLDLCSCLFFNPVH